MRTPCVVIGAGQVGAAAAAALVQRGLDPADLRLTVLRQESVARLSHVCSNVRAVALDDAEALREVLAGAGSVLFSAAPGRGGSGRAVYVDGLRQVLDALDPERLRSGDLHFVYTSSTGVYAEERGGRVDETARLARGGSARAETLIEAEDQLLAHFEGRGRLTILRLSGLVGPQRGPQRRLHFVAGARREDGASWLNLVFVDDVAEVVARVFDREHTGVYNVSSPRPLTRREFYEPLLERAGLAPAEWIEPSEEIGLGRRILVDKLRDEVGVLPRVVDPKTLPL